LPVALIGGSDPLMDAHPPGVYQIGLVYARSCTSMIVPSGISMSKNFASYAVQRGVGIVHDSYPLSP